MASMQVSARCPPAPCILAGRRQHAESIRCCATRKHASLAERGLLAAGAALVLTLVPSTTHAQAAWKPFADPVQKVAVKDQSLQAVDQTRKVVADSTSLAASADALLQLQGLPEEERKLAAQMKEAATLITSISQDMLTQQQFRLANEVLQASVASPAPPVKAGPASEPAASTLKGGKQLVLTSSEDEGAAQEGAVGTAAEAGGEAEVEVVVVEELVARDPGSSAVSLKAAVGKPIVKDLLQSLLP